MGRHRVLLATPATESVRTLATCVRAVDAMAPGPVEARDRGVADRAGPDRIGLGVRVRGIDHAATSSIVKAPLDHGAGRRTAVDVEGGLAGWGGWKVLAVSGSLHRMMMRIGVLQR